MYDDTIAAIATAIGGAGIGIVRVSGPDAVAILGRVFRPSGSRRDATPRDGRLEAQPAWPESHRLYHGHVADPSNGEIVDEALALCMLAPRSYTREDVVELHCHGGPAPLQRVLGAVLASGARLAQPGEFTLRAFLNGRIDLVQAEAVADVIRARTDRGLALAMKGLGGSLSRPVRELRRSMLDVLAYLEATIDFAEDDIPPQDVRRPLTDCLATVRDLLSTADQGIISRQGVRVAIVGRPNVGKSSLLNALLRTDRAIVTEVPGTTRDTLEEVASLSGIPVCLVDTAGIAAAQDPVERLGVERSRRAIAEADLCLLVIDRSQPITTEDREVAETVGGRPVVVVANKADLRAAISRDQLRAALPDCPIVSTSTLTGEGLGNLRQAILSAVLSGQVLQSDALLVSNPRHKDVLLRTESHLADALASLDAGLPADCTASDLRLAMDALGEITGETATDGLLDAIFSRFCIGK